eukprot:CAMPEP_0203756892 /NCGR_PEP_ID=MMETSP0098-20131031/10087_1 /ASSEMBLY_ACC=CAM_ASM_000208 /TAXON_ID=96639 /ORGANISM=" , Strain NY0313808BC1" /LENGTH=1421 /DNA_ID=CAMNT_0050648941 /DNA_START=878 /DNA_END=5139 /DNA_ORIENTATION=-
MAEEESGSGFKEPTGQPTRKPTTNTPTLGPTFGPTTSTPTSEPTAQPTLSPTPCHHSCSPHYYNQRWKADREAVSCRQDLICKVCPPGFYKYEGSGWTTCNDCGNTDKYCLGGQRHSRSQASCTFSSKAVEALRRSGDLLTQIDVEFMEKDMYPEHLVRDKVGNCGQLVVVTPGLELTVVKPASSFQKVVVRNTGDTPLNIQDITMPSWISLYDPEHSEQVVDPGPIYVLGKSEKVVHIWIKSSGMPAGDSISSGKIRIKPRPVFENNEAPHGAHEIPVVVEMSEPSLSILPSKASWTMNIGATSLQHLTLSNMQVKEFDWIAEVRHENNTGQHWIKVSPEMGKLARGFKCGGDGEVIETKGVTKVELSVHLDANHLEPGIYVAHIKVRNQANANDPGVESTVVINVLPGVMRPNSTTFAFVGEELIGRSLEVVQSVQLPETKVQIFPRDEFGKLTTSFGEMEKHFHVVWSGEGSNAESGRLVIDRNEVDNSFIGDLKILRQGVYKIDIRTEPTNEHIQGSPFTINVTPRSCNEVVNSQPHPETGYSCVCSAGYGKSQDSETCEPCPTGQFRDASMLMKTQYCRACGLGSFQDAKGSTRCKFCPLGHQPEPEQTACTPCQLNHVVDYLSPGRSCTPCGTEFTVVDNKCVCKPEFYLGGNNTCQPCPEGAFCGYGNASTMLPLFGYWRTQWDPFRFEKCVHEEACLGVTKENSFLLRDPEAWELFVKDPWRRQQAVLKAVNGSSGGSLDESVRVFIPPVDEMNKCAEGFTGPLCNECAPGYYPIGTGYSCFQCDATARTVGFFILSVLVGFCALFYLVSRTIKARGAPRRREVMVLKIVLSHLQIIALTKKFPLNWPPAVASFFSVFDILSSAGNSALSTHCLFYAGNNITIPVLGYPVDRPGNSSADSPSDDDDAYGLSRWVFIGRSLSYALAPVLLLILFAFIWKVVVPLYRDTSNDLLTVKQKVIVSNVVLLIVLQPFLTRAGFEFFSCSDKLDGRSFLEAQFTIQCWSGVHRRWIGLGAFMLAVYAVGIPLYAAYILYCVVRKRLCCSKKKSKAAVVKHVSCDDSYTTISSLYSTSKQERSDLEKWRPVYGFIYSGYRKECYFWEIVVMLRKAAFATVSVVLRPVGVDIQTYVGMLVLVASIALHIHYHPYSAVSRLHVLETTSLSICFLTLVCGLFIYSPNTMTTFKQGCTMFIVLANVLFFLYVLYTIRGTLATSIQNGFHRAFKFCCRKRYEEKYPLSEQSDDLEANDDDQHQDASDDFNSVDSDKVSRKCDSDRSFELRNKAQQLKNDGDMEAATAAALEAVDVALIALQKQQLEMGGETSYKNRSRSFSQGGGIRKRLSSLVLGAPRPSAGTVLHSDNIEEESLEDVTDSYQRIFSPQCSPDRFPESIDLGQLEMVVSGPPSLVKTDNNDTQL